MAVRSASSETTKQVPASPPARVEIRVAGRVRFAQDCYDIHLGVDGSTVKFHAALEPTLVDVAAPVAERFEDDPRNSATVIQQVHSGSRRKRPAPEVAAPSPKEQGDDE